MDIGHIGNLVCDAERKIIYTREQVFGGRQLTQDVQKPLWSIFFEEAGRAKKKRTLPDDYDTEVLEPFLSAVVQQAARSSQFSSHHHSLIEIDHIIYWRVVMPIFLDFGQTILQQKLGYRVTVLIHSYKWAFLH